MATAATLVAILTPARAQILINTDRTMANGNPINSAFPAQTVFVGLADDKTTRVSGVHVDVISPAVLPYSNFTGGGITFLSDSIGSIQGGDISGVSASEQSVVTVTGGNLGGVSVGAQADLTMSGGTTTTSGGQITAYVSGGSLTVNSGTVLSGNYVVMGFGGNITINGGSIGIAGTSPSVNVYGTSAGNDTALIVNGGSLLNGLSTTSTVTTLVRGGTINGGLISDLTGAIRVSGGSITGSLIGSGGGAFDIAGGSFGGTGDYKTFGNASASISGGTFANTFALLGAGDINFIGSELTLSDATTGTYINPDTYFGASSFDGTFYRLTGTLASGQSIDRTVFRAASATGQIRFASTAAPEPTTLLLAAPCLAASRVVRRWRRSV